MTGDDIIARADEIGGLIQERLGYGGRTLARQIARAGRALPRPVAREARFLAQAAQIAANPRLVRMIDPARVDSAHRVVRDHLRNIDRRERRRARLTGIAAVVAFNLIVVAALVIAVLVWRGYA